MRLRPVCALLLVLALAACREAAEPRPLDVPGQKLYPVTGRILGRSASDNTIRTDHDAIPGFMEAMTMDYSVRGVKVEALPADGTRFSATLHVTDDGYWLTGVKKAP